MRARLVGIKAFAGWQIGGSDTHVLVPVGTEGDARPRPGHLHRVHDFITDDGVCVPVKSENYVVLE